MISDSELLGLDAAGRDPLAFCEDWLRQGVCGGERTRGGCGRMHAYPPTWTDEDVLEHRRMIEALIEHGTASESEEEAEEDEEEIEQKQQQKAAVRVLQKFVHEDSDDEGEDVQELGPGDQWRAVGAKRGQPSEPHARKRKQAPPPGDDDDDDDDDASAAPAGMDVPRRVSPPAAEQLPHRRIEFEFTDGQALASVPANQLERWLPLLRDPDALVAPGSRIYVAVESPMGPRTVTPVHAAEGTTGLSRARLLQALSQGLVDHEDEFRIGSVSYSPSERLCTVQLEL